ncbi:MAG: hypothetical protein WBE72_19850, partial [Terracidiphilus sp.]
MSNFAEDEPLNAGADEQPQHSIEETISEDAIAYTITGPFDAAPAEAAVAELPMFHSVMEPEPEPVRIPHLGHFLLMLVLLIAGFIGAILVMLIALHFHLYGV